MVWLKETVFMAILVSFNVIDKCWAKRSLGLERDVLNKVFKEYDPRIRPASSNETGPLHVRVNLYVRNIDAIDDSKMEYDTQITFRQSWMDERLKYHAKAGDYVNLYNTERIWTPDIFFSNEKTGHTHNIMTPNNLIRLYPNGTILYSVRLSLRLSCPMNLKNYPMDNQMCSLIIASYGHTTEDIVFLWKVDEPVQITRNLHLPNFHLMRFFTDYCTSRTNTGEYSCLKLDFLLSRDINYYLRAIFYPTIALVLLSWIPFWLNPRCTNIRFCIWLGSFLAMFLMSAYINYSNPAVSYTKAIDVWTGVCISFIFFVAIELCIVSNIVSLADNESLLVADDKCIAEGKSMEMDYLGKYSRIRRYSSAVLKWFKNRLGTAERIDTISRVLFFAAFVFFNLIYWLTYRHE